MWLAEYLQLIYIILLEIKDFFLSGWICLGALEFYFEYSIKHKFVFTSFNNACWITIWGHKAYINAWWILCLHISYSNDFHSLWGLQLEAIPLYVSRLWKKIDQPSLWPSDSSCESQTAVPAPLHSRRLLPISASSSPKALLTWLRMKGVYSLPHPHVVRTEMPRTPTMHTMEFFFSAGLLTSFISSSIA